MTIAVSLKVHDGLILAADIASTVFQQAPGGPAVIVNIYNNANKIVNLHKGLPIGVISWGAGNIGSASISTLLKDLRRRFGGGDSDRKDWSIDRANYSIEAVAKRVREFVFEENYRGAFAGWNPPPAMGMIVGDTRPAR